MIIRFVLLLVGIFFTWLIQRDNHKVLYAFLCVLLAILKSCNNIVFFFVCFQTTLDNVKVATLEVIFNM